MQGIPRKTVKIQNKQKSKKGRSLEKKQQAEKATNTNLGNPAAGPQYQICVSFSFQLNQKQQQQQRRQQTKKTCAGEWIIFALVCVCEEKEREQATIRDFFVVGLELL